MLIKSNDRFEKARSAEKAFSNLRISDALQIFELSSIAELNQYTASQAEQAEEHGFIWKIEGERLYFHSVIIFAAFSVLFL
jgi:hypothetical protein